MVSDRTEKYLLTIGSWPGRVVSTKRILFVDNSEGSMWTDFMRNIEAKMSKKLKEGFC